MLGGSHLLAVVKHSEEEHGHEEQRRLFGSQEVSVEAENKQLVMLLVSNKQEPPLVYNQFDLRCWEPKVFRWDADVFILLSSFQDR